MSIKGATLLEAIRVPDNPFPGLRPFEFDESDLFFGRDGQVGKLITKLTQSRFLAVVGTSGSGKSSLVRAGLLPALSAGMMTNVGSKWRMAVLRPGNDPIGSLALKLNEPEVFGSDDPENTDIQIAVTDATLRRGQRGLVEIVRQNAMPTDENLLVVVDQFEELFRFAREASRKTKYESDRYQNDAAAFVKLLLEARKQRDVNIFVVLTMRSDFLGDCARFWDLPEAVNESQYLIPRLTREQLREVITGPISRAGGDITCALVTQLLNDIGADQDQDELPVLQHLLMRAWNEWKEKRLGIEVAGEDGVTIKPHAEIHQVHAIDLCCYEAVGGMAEALSRHADEAFNELPDKEHRKVAENIFKALTEKGFDNREIRRPLMLEEICLVTGATSKEVATVVNTFRQADRSFLMPPAKVRLELKSLIDISHESLIRGWKRLKEWTEDEAQSARLYKWLAETSVLHSDRGGALLRGAMLQLILEWQDKNYPNASWAARYHSDFEKAMTFLKASVVGNQEQELAEKTRLERELKSARDLAEQQEKLATLQTDATKRRTRYLVGLGFLAILTVGLLVVAISFQRSALANEMSLKDNALKAEQLAKTERGRAELREKEAQLAREDLQKQKDKLVTSLGNEEKARKEALVAQSAAEKERDNARRLQGEKQQQATIYGYFKNAFDDLAAGQHEQAADKLEEALEYFTSKKDTPNIISTRINIGDIYRNSEDPFDEDSAGDSAIENYNEALKLIRAGNGNETILLSTLEKAASVWSESNESDEKDAAAAYHEEAVGIYHKLGKKDEEAARLMDIGKIYSRSSDDDSTQSARQAFARAIKVQEGSHIKAAETNLEIGVLYETVLENALKETEDDNDEALQDEQAPTEERRRLLNERVDNQTRLRRTARTYFIAASREYDAAGENQKAAEMFVKAGQVLAESKVIDLKNQAAGDFVNAASKYAQAGDTRGQTTALVSAGDIYREADDKELWPKAEEYYEQAVKVFHDAGMVSEEAAILTSIGRSYGSGDEPAQKRTGVEKYQRAAILYRQSQKKTEESDAYISAAGILEKIDGEESQRNAEAFYEQAVGVYQNDIPNQVATLIKIGRSLYRMSGEARRAKAENYFGKAIAFAEQHGGSKSAAPAYLDVGVQYSTLGKTTLAFANFEQSLKLYEGLNDTFGQAMALYRLASTATRIRDKRPLSEGFAERSLALFTRALPEAQVSNNKKNLADGYFAMGSLYRQKKMHERALESYQKALEIYKTIPGQRGRVSAVNNYIRNLQKILTQSR